MTSSFNDSSTRVLFGAAETGARISVYFPSVLISHLLNGVGIAIV